MAATGATPASWKIGFTLMTSTAWMIPLLLVGTVFHPARAVGRFLETAPMRWLGRLSYSLYLWQQLFLVWPPWPAPALRPLQAFPVNVAAAFVLACLSHYLVEQPLIELGRELGGGAVPYRGSLRS